MMKEDESMPPHAPTREERVLKSRTVKLTKQGKIPDKK